MTYASAVAAVRQESLSTSTPVAAIGRPADYVYSAYCEPKIRCKNHCHLGTNIRSLSNVSKNIQRSLVVLATRCFHDETYVTDHWPVPKLLCRKFMIVYTVNCGCFYLYAVPDSYAIIPLIIVKANTCSAFCSSQFSSAFSWLVTCETWTVASLAALGRSATR